MAVLINNLRDYLDKFKSSMKNEHIPTINPKCQTSVIHDEHLFCSKIIMAVQEYKDRKAPHQKQETVCEIINEIFKLLLENLDLKDEMKKFLEHHLCRYENNDLVNNFFNDLKLKFKSLSSAEAKQLLSSGSSWTADMLIDLFDCLSSSNLRKINIKYQPMFRKLNASLILSKENDLSNDFQQCGLQNSQKFCEKLEIKKRFTSSLKILTSDWDQRDTPFSAFKELAECNANETASRTLIDAILLPILEDIDLKVGYEETFKFKDLPTNRLDYIIKKKEGQHIGVIEAKKLGAMNEKSLVQAMLQLVCLQKRGNCADTIFAVVTDAMHYHMMTLSGDTVVMDNGYDDAARYLMDKKSDFIHPVFGTVESWEDLYDITYDIYKLCQVGKMNLQY